MTEKQKTELVSAAQTAGARGDGFDAFWEDVQAEVARLQGTAPDVEPRLTKTPPRDIVETYGDTR
jgi:hypothetical protein